MLLTLGSSVSRGASSDGDSRDLKEVASWCFQLHLLEKIQLEIAHQELVANQPAHLEPYKKDLNVSFFCWCYFVSVKWADGDDLRHVGIISAWLKEVVRDSVDQAQAVDAGRFLLCLRLHQKLPLQRKHPFWIYSFSSKLVNMNGKNGLFFFFLFFLPCVGILFMVVTVFLIFLNDCSVSNPFIQSILVGDLREKLMIHQFNYGENCHFIFDGTISNTFTFPFRLPLR